MMSAEKEATSVTKIIRNVRELLQDPQRWTKETLARDEQGETRLPESPKATCWCLLGALDSQVSYTSDRHMDIEQALVKNIKKLFPRRTSQTAFHLPITEFNDHPDTMHEDVLKVLDETLANLTGEEIEGNVDGH